MPLLFDEDYQELRGHGLAYQEDEPNRFFIFLDYILPDAIYTIGNCNVLVVIPPNYNQAGNDMFWTYPRLVRVNGKVIPQTMDPGGGDSRRYAGVEYCRWSRHWNPGSPEAWRPGRDNIISIHRRIDWALRNPGG